MELGLALVFGLVIGSFLNVVILRLPLRESISLPSSRCPHCKRPIAPYDNIPIASYFLLGGRCRHCSARISPRYPAVEAATALLSLLLYLKFGLSLEWACYLAFGGALLALALIDADHRILPDAITLNGIWAGILVSAALARPDGLITRLVAWLGPGITHPRLLAILGSGLGMLVGGGVLWLVGEAFYRIRGIEGMGFGDVKMMAMVGAFLGAPLAIFTIMVGSVLGSVIGLVWIVIRGKGREYELPFGTFLAIAAIAGVLYGNTLIHLYMARTFGP